MADETQTTVRCDGSGRLCPFGATVASAICRSCNQVVVVTATGRFIDHDLPDKPTVNDG